MNFSNIRVYNFECALRGMRNPKNSWNKTDSYFGLIDVNDDEHDFNVAIKWNETHPDKNVEEWDRWIMANGILDIDPNHQHAIAAFIGPNDMHLAQTLIKAGPEHRKFMRQIFVSVDITAPLYWWKEFDTYKVGTVANSTSTMHKLTSKPITLDCFEIDDYNPDLILEEGKEVQRMTTFEDEPISWSVNSIIDYCEKLRQKYIETKDNRYWKELVRWLPESWLQTRTVTMNYENLLAICSKSQRRFHKLTEWSGNGEDFSNESFIKFARKLPYAKEFIFIDEQAKQEDN